VLFQFHELYLPPRRSIKEKVIKMVTVREKESKQYIYINKNYLCSREDDKNERNKSNMFILIMSSNQPLEILVHQELRFFICYNKKNSYLL
jgi:hypothetical protein